MDFVRSGRPAFKVCNGSVADVGNVLRGFRLGDMLCWLDRLRSPKRGQWLPERLPSYHHQHENQKMNLPFSGGCACGSIRYTGSQAPIAMINCHCSDCQRSSGAPFASGIVVMTGCLQVSGTPKSHTVRAGSGGLVTRSFCSDCGTPLFTSSGANPKFTSIRFPSLDDASGFKPMLDIYTESAQQWVCLDATIPHFPRSPQ
jgi:hypothetical protein